MFTVTVKSTKTIVVSDYGTQKVTDVLELLTENYNVLFVSSKNLPDLPVSSAKILSILLFCIKPDAEVLQTVKTLRAAYMGLNIAVLSPVPSTDIITDTLKMGATDYFDLTEPHNLRLFNWLKQIHHTKSPPSVWERIKAWLQPSASHAQPSISQNIVSVEPILSLFSEKLNNNDLLDNKVENCIEVQFLGDFSIKVNGQPVFPKANSLLLAYLLFYHNRPIHKETLMAKFWSEHVNDARNNLNVAIHTLRKSLREVITDKTPIILFQNDFYSINTAYWHIESDIEQFTQHWSKSKNLLQTQGLSAAVDDFMMIKSLYRDDFLLNFNHEWVTAKRDEYREKYLQTLNLLCEHYWKHQQYRDCIEFCLDILTVDDCVEATHRRLIECFVKLDMKDRAVRQYKRCVEALKRLNMMPEKETELMYKKILEVC